MKGFVGATIFAVTAYLVLGSQRAPEHAITMETESSAIQHSSDQVNGSDIVIPDFFNIGAWSVFLPAQVTPASIDDIFPTGPLRLLYSGNEKYRLKVCNRTAVKDCMPTGTSQRDTTLVSGAMWLANCTLSLSETLKVQE
jgi:hypothetical protein